MQVIKLTMKSNDPQINPYKANFADDIAGKKSGIEARP